MTTESDLAKALERIKTMTEESVAATLVGVHSIAAQALAAYSAPQEGVKEAPSGLEAGDLEWLRRQRRAFEKAGEHDAIVACIDRILAALSAND